MSRRDCRDCSCSPATPASPVAEAFTKSTRSLCRELVLVLKVGTTHA